VESKAEIRKHFRQLTKAFASDPARLRRSDEIWAAAETMPEFQQAESILVYCALPDEPETKDFIKRWYGKKRIIVPLVIGDDLILKEYSPEKTHAGYCGIIEPDADAPTVDPSEVELAFVPGVVFDCAGSRFGRGKGFYDRLLPSLNCPKVGICYSFQIYEGILPTEDWDCRMDVVLHK